MRFVQDLTHDELVQLGRLAYSMALDLQGLTSYVRDAERHTIDHHIAIRKADHAESKGRAALRILEQPAKEK